MEFRRITGLPPYVLTIINNLKTEARRAGEDVLDFGFGNPDIPSPDIAVDRLATCMKPRRLTPPASAETSKVPPANSLAAPGAGPWRSRSSALRQYFGADDATPPFAAGAATTGSDRRPARSFARASWLSSQLME